MKKIWQDNGTRFVGKVEYSPLNEIKKEDFMERKFGHYVKMFNSRGIARTFLFKDDFYEREGEVRFIVKEEGNDNRTCIMVPCSNLKDCIQKVIVDPRADTSFFHTVQDELKAFGIKAEKADPLPVKYKFTKK